MGQPPILTSQLRNLVSDRISRTMAEPENDKRPAAPLFHQPPPGYWRTKLKLARMVRFKNLIIHRERWDGDKDMATPNTQLFPGEKGDANSSVTLKRENQETQQSMWMWTRRQRKRAR